MPKATHQADRLDAERQHAPQPPARVVEARYRLQPADLPPAGLVGEVTRVTRQGVEAITPVLHLRGAPKPLLLDGENMRRMGAVTGSPLHTEWVSATVALRSITEDGRPVIRIFAADAGIDAPHTAARRPAGSQWRAALLLLLVLLLAFGAVYLVENWSAVAGLLTR